MNKILGFILIASLLVLVGCITPSSQYQVNEGWVFGTSYRIVYKSDDDRHQEIKMLLDSFNRSLSTFDTTSTISVINRSDKGGITDPFFVNVVQAATEITHETNGAFDITVAPLANAWGFGFSKSGEVTKVKIDSLLQFVGMEKITLEEGSLAKAFPGVMLDCSAIAKGYGVDVVASYLRSNGIKDFMVEIGGEVSTKGVNQKGYAWRIGIDSPIDDPTAENRELKLIIQLSGQSLATSGNYRNFYVKDGVKYAHTIDPRTGYPVSHSLLSASIIANDCMTADAYATACMVLGLDESVYLIERLSGIEACFIYSNDEGEQLMFTSGFSEYVK